MAIRSNIDEKAKTLPTVLDRATDVLDVPSRRNIRVGDRPTTLTPYPTTNLKATLVKAPRPLVRWIDGTVRDAALTKGRGPTVCGTSYSVYFWRPLEGGGEAREWLPLTASEYWAADGGTVLELKPIEGVPVPPPSGTPHANTRRGVPKVEPVAEEPMPEIEPVAEEPMPEIEPVVEEPVVEEPVVEEPVVEEPKPMTRREKRAGRK